ncbi:hypothetical protein OSB04_000549 [Centaurea solstitialis]|uniref:Uncharacterized protein n=1 Tax=Centaurea solstitialis TaxID=347529 RepID=A0AA38TPA4_9ASTR|nr:hypothetical protein OSB04_000549 [Centaurea solstitialis]
MVNSSNPQRRSISLPTRLSSTPSFSQIETNLKKLKTLVPFYSSETIQTGFVCLVDLYLSVDGLIGSSQIQQVNLESRNKGLVEAALIGSTGLLDYYSKLMGFLTPMKENVRTLQSALRRKGSSEADRYLSDYVLYRNKAKKSMAKSLGLLDQMEKDSILFLGHGEDHHLSMVVGVLREIMTATISIFRALLLCLFGKMKPTVKYGFSLITKLVSTARPDCDENQEIVNDNDQIDVALHSLHKKFKNKGSTVDEEQIVMEGLLNLDRQIERYEVGLDSLSRRLIQTRVSLLNILVN